MDVVEFGREFPGVFSIVYFETAVWWNALRLALIVRGSGSQYYCGWIGLRSVPRTFAEGWRLAESF